MSVLSESQEKGNFHAYALGQQAQASPYTVESKEVMHALNTVLKKIYRERGDFHF